MVLASFTVMSCPVLMMLRCFVMVFGSILGHVLSFSASVAGADLDNGTDAERPGIPLFVQLSLGFRSKRQRSMSKRQP
jgi:hypothetical protein